MTNFTGLNLPQMIAATKADIIRAQGLGLADAFDKRHLIQYLLGLEDTYALTTREVREDGQVVLLETIERDIETDAIVRRKRWEYDYYPTGELRDVLIRELDADSGEVTRRRIRHFLDGRQPIEVEG